jgi:uncharacterized coiled-coil protein SlyX
MADSLAEAVTDLEIRVAYQDRALAALDEVVRTLYKKVESLEVDLAEVRRNAEGALPIGPANEQPPHY